MSKRTSDTDPMGVPPIVEPPAGAKEQIPYAPSTGNAGLNELLLGLAPSRAGEPRRIEATAGELAAAYEHGPIPLRPRFATPAEEPKIVLECTSELSPPVTAPVLELPVQDPLFGAFEPTLKLRRPASGPPPSGDLPILPRGGQRSGTLLLVGLAAALSTLLLITLAILKEPRRRPTHVGVESLRTANSEAPAASIAPVSAPGTPSVLAPPSASQRPIGSRSAASWSPAKPSARSVPKPPPEYELLK